jgi:pimeloyl-ACP methyl ester carboxylesterase
MTLSPGERDFTVEAPDGVPIAVWVDGSGPPIVLVHGSFTDHTAWTIPIEVLSRHFTTYALDRRGFGASGDGDDYTIRQDFGDVAAAIDAVASRSGEPVVLWGHSYGANCAMGGADLSEAVSHLVLYEPSLGLQYPMGAIEAAEAALAAGDSEGVVARLLFEILEMTDQEIAGMKSSPRWPIILAGAHTVPREAREEQGWIYTAGQFDGIAAPALLLSGGDSSPAIVEATRRAADAIAGSRVQVLDGHGHFAHRTDPEMVVSVILDFVGVV